MYHPDGTVTLGQMKLPEEESTFWDNAIVRIDWVALLLQSCGLAPWFVIRRAIRMSAGPVYDQPNVAGPHVTSDWIGKNDRRGTAELEGRLAAVLLAILSTMRLVSVAESVQEPPSQSL